MKLISLAAQMVGALQATVRKSYVSLRNETPNVARSATVATVQSAITAAEAGDTRQLFGLYRDLTVGGSHIQCEMGKRKMAVLSQPHSIQPADKENADDVAAALAVEQMIADCENWTDGIGHLLDGTMWPLAAVEKIFRPSGEAMPGKPRLMYTLGRLHLVNPALFCFKQPYVQRSTESRATETGEQWEPELRFYSTDENGAINWSYDSAYPAERPRHIIHRGHLLVGVRDNWGGPMRSIVFWWLLSVLGRDWFARAMERYGSPFPVAKTDGSNQDAVNFLKEALSLSTKVGGLVVDNDTQVELIEAMTSGMADAHEKFLGVCNREISKVIVGQELSSTAQPTGLGSGVAKLQGEVREDIRAFDQIKLAETLHRQLFDPFLRMNGLNGRVKIVWGGLSADEAEGTATMLQTLANAGLEPTDEAIPTISERVGFQLQRKAPPEPQAMPGAGGGAFGRGLSPQFAKSWPDLNGVGIGGLKTFAAQGLAAGLGVPVAWLAPLRKHLADIEAKARDKSVSDADLLEFLQAGNDRLPELFGTMDLDGLARVFEIGMGAAIIDGVRAGYRAKPELLDLSARAPAALPAPTPVSLHLEMKPEANVTKTLTPIRSDDGTILRYELSQTPAAE